MTPALAPAAPPLPVTPAAPAGPAAALAPAAAGLTALGSPPGGAPPGGAPPGGAPPDGAPPAPMFASVLTASVARTAFAEGQPKAAREAGGRQGKIADTDATATDPESLLAAQQALGTAVMVAARTAPAATTVKGADAPELSDTSAGPMQDAPTRRPAGPAPLPQLPAVGALQDASAQGGTPAPAPSAALTDATPGPAGAPATPPATQPTAATGAQVPASSPAPPPAAKPPHVPAAADRPRAATAAASAPPPAGPSAAPSAATTAPPSGTTAGGEVHQGRPHHPGSAAPAPAATGAIAPAASATTPGTAPSAAPPTVDAKTTAKPAPPALAERPVPMHRAAEAVRRTIELSARQGVSAARIQLSPASLGTIRIHLQRTADGLVARVVAGHDAAQAFTQSAGELRRSLQASGLSLVRLDIDVAGDRDAADRGALPQQRGGGGRDRDGATSSDDTTSPDAAAEITRTVELSAGALVNVLA